MAVGDHPTDEADRPWTALSPQIADVLRPVLPEVVEAAIAQIAAQIPALGQLVGGGGDPYGRALHRGVELALSRFLDLLGTQRMALEPALAQVYDSFGEQESERGHGLDALLAAYRLGARVTWARFSAAAVQAGVSTDDLVVLAEAIFVYIDELSSASAQGHARRHAAEAGYRDLLRSRLATAIMDGETARAAAQVHRLAAEVGWVLPERLAVAVLPVPTDAASTRRLPMAPPDVLVLAQEGEVLAVVPDPSGPGRRDRLTAALGLDVEVYVGTVRPPDEAPISLADARAVQRLVAEGIVPRAPLVAAADHLPELLLHAEPRLLADLSQRVLAPLSGLSPARRAVLTETLRCWLAHQGDRAAVAHDLAVHPQTVTYRMAQLTTLFGDSLRDPTRRLALTLALESPPNP